MHKYSSSATCFCSNASGAFPHNCKSSAETRQLKGVRARLGTMQLSLGGSFPLGRIADIPIRLHSKCSMRVAVGAADSRAQRLSEASYPGPCDRALRSRACNASWCL